MEENSKATLNQFFLYKPPRESKSEAALSKQKPLIEYYLGFYFSWFYETNAMDKKFDQNDKKS